MDQSVYIRLYTEPGRYDSALKLFLWKKQVSTLPTMIQIFSDPIKCPWLQVSLELQFMVINIVYFLVLCHSFVPPSFCPVSRSAPDASPRVALSPPVFYRAGIVWPLSCKMAAHGALSWPIRQIYRSDREQSPLASASAEACLKQNAEHWKLKTWKWKVAKEEVKSYFKEGLVVILVPTPIKPSCLLQKSLQCSHLCREVSVQEFTLMLKIMLWTHISPLYI